MTILSMSGMRFGLLLILTATVGSIAGATTAFVVTPYVAPVQIENISNLPPVTPPTSTAEVTPSLIKLETHLSTPLIPPEFIHRGVSSVAAIYRKPKGTTLEEKTLNEDRLLGQAVAMTSDGWFITMGSVISNLHLTDLTIWHAGKSYEVTQAVADHVNGTVFFKTKARDLPAAGFGQPLDLVPGSGLWTERRPSVFAPTLVTSLVDPHTAATVTSSEVASRRMMLDGSIQVGDVGSAVWDARGSLIGLVDGETGSAMRILPVTSISTSLNALLTSNGLIRHAQLGVHSRDLAMWKIDGDRGTLPVRGAYIVEEKKSAKLGIKDSVGYKAGLRAGDVIVGIEHDTLDGALDLGELLSEYKFGSRVTVHVHRDGNDIEIPLTLGTNTTSEAFK